MNHCIVLSGGVGSRMKLDIPKQYYKVNGIPVIIYSLRKLARCNSINSIVIVLSDDWVESMREWIAKDDYPCKVLFAKSGDSRQHSVLNGLEVLKEYAAENDVVFIHDAVRPLFPVSIITEGIKACALYDGAIPVIPVKDATYRSRDGKTISAIIDREELYLGQSPECFLFKKFYDAHAHLSDDDISTIRGCSELAFIANLSIQLIQGAEENYKLTTMEDLRTFEHSFDVDRN